MPNKAGPALGTRVPRPVWMYTSAYFSGPRGPRGPNLILLPPDLAPAPIGNLQVDYDGARWGPLWPRLEKKEGGRGPFLPLKNRKFTGSGPNLISQNGPFSKARAPRLLFFKAYNRRRSLSFWKGFDRPIRAKNERENPKNSRARRAIFHFSCKT